MPARIIGAIRRLQQSAVQDFHVDFPSQSIESLLQATERFTTEVRPQVAYASPPRGELQVGRAPWARHCRVQSTPIGHRCGR